MGARRGLGQGRAGGGAARLSLPRSRAGVPDRPRGVGRDDLRAPRAGAQHRGGLRGPPRPGLRRLLRHRRLRHGAPELPRPRLAALRARVELLALHLDRRRGVGAARRGHRRADPAGPWRLPGHHHAGVRRDHPGRHPQPRRRHHRHRRLAAGGAAQPHRRRERRQPRGPPLPARGAVRDRSDPVVLPDPRRRRALALGDEPAPGLAAGPRLDGHPGGRDRRRLHGREPDLDQAAGLRAGRLLLRLRGLDLRGQAPGHHAGRVRVPGLDHAAVHGRPRRRRQPQGRHPRARCSSPSSIASSSPRPPS